PISCAVEVSPRLMVFLDHDDLPALPLAVCRAILSLRLDACSPLALTGSADPDQYSDIFIHQISPSLSLRNHSRAWPAPFVLPNHPNPRGLSACDGSQDSIDGAFDTRRPPIRAS